MTTIMTETEKPMILGVTYITFHHLKFQSSNFVYDREPELRNRKIGSFDFISTLIFLISNIFCFICRQPGRRDFGFGHFNMYSDPLELARYFENQMDGMLKNFFGFGDESIISSSSPFFEGC